MTKEEFEAKVKEMALQIDGAEKYISISIDMTIEGGAFKQAYCTIDEF